MVGVGAPARGDDSVGLHVVRRLAEQRLPPGWSVSEVAGGWLSLLDLLEGVGRLVVVDACDVGLEPGTVFEMDPLSLTPLGAPGGLGHALGLGEVLDLARALGRPVPAEVRVLVVQVGALTGLGEVCSPAVAAAIEAACRAVRRLGR